MSRDIQGKHFELERLALVRAHMPDCTLPVLPHIAVELQGQTLVQVGDPARTATFGRPESGVAHMRLVAVLQKDSYLGVGLGVACLRTAVDGLLQFGHRGSDGEEQSQVDHQEEEEEEGTK